MKFDTIQEGLLTILKPFWALPMEHPWGLDGKSMFGLNPGKVHEHHRGNPEKSGASVTFLLNDGGDEGVPECEEGTGKGGYHEIYHLRGRNLNYKPQEKGRLASCLARAAFNSISGRGRIVGLHA